MILGPSLGNRSKMLSDPSLDNRSKLVILSQVKDKNKPVFVGREDMKKARTKTKIMIGSEEI